jgi:hypothetical protein
VDIDQIIYIQLLKTMNDSIANNADDTIQDANTLIQFFNAPYDTVSLGSTILSTLATDPNTNMVWASSSVNSGFTWDDGGIYDPTFNTLFTPSETLTLGATVTTTLAFPADLVWGSDTVDSNWSWGMGVWRDNRHQISLSLFPVIYEITEDFTEIHKAITHKSLTLFPVIVDILEVYS